MIKGIIFDMGGVLRDSRQIFNRGIKTAFEDQGLEYKYCPEDIIYFWGIDKVPFKSFVKRLVLNRKKTPELPHLRSLDEIPLPEGIDLHLLTERAKDIINNDRKSEEVMAYPGVKEVIEKLTENYVLGAYTNGNKKNADLFLQDHGMFEYFNVILGNDFIKNRKPAPDGILKAIEDLGLIPNECAYVGDTGVDIEAAKAAGCMSIAVTYGYCPRQILEEFSPDIIIESLDKLLELDLYSTKHTTKA